MKRISPATVTFGVMAIVLGLVSAYIVKQAMHKPPVVAKPAPPAPKCGGSEATIVGTDGNDVIVGTDGHDVIAALGGDDQVRGLGGKDLVCGFGGNDRLKGQAVAAVTTCCAAAPAVTRVAVVAATTSSEAADSERGRCPCD